ncbi:hypothetical protein HZS_8104, partial [Henneguya salminicola]
MNSIQKNKYLEHGCLVEIKKQLAILKGELNNPPYLYSHIDTIEIISEVDEEEKQFKQRRSYNYKVMMIKNEISMEMRGRCSSGQKMIASIIIRLALFKAFCSGCCFIALDEPTTNLDENNIKGFAESLHQIALRATDTDNFQLIVITHDEKFLSHICRNQDAEYYFQVYKDENGFSTVSSR